MIRPISTPAAAARGSYASAVVSAQAEYLPPVQASLPPQLPMLSYTPQETVMPVFTIHAGLPQRYAPHGMAVVHAAYALGIGLPDRSALTGNNVSLII